jgi:hypothetical protein
MANFLYASARSKFLGGALAWTSGTYRVLFLNGAAASGGTWSGIGTTGWPLTTLNNIPSYIRSRAVASTAQTVMDLASGTYLSAGNVAATSFAPTQSGHGYTIDGEARGNDLTYSAVATTTGTLSAFVLYKDSGTESTSDLVAYFDTATNLPIPANGGDITIQWSTSPNYIFKL